MGCAASSYGVQEDASIWQRVMEESKPGGEGHSSSKEILSARDPPTLKKEDHEMNVSHDHGDEDQEDDLSERRISNFDASNLVGSPSFREYCLPIQSSSDDDEEDNHDDNDVKNILKDEKVTNEMTPKEVCETRAKTSSGTRRRLRNATSAIFAIANVRNIFSPSRQT